MNREEKSELVQTLKGVFDNATLVVVTHNKGLSVAEITDLRTKVREVGASFKVTQNRLTKIALEGTRFQALTETFRGPTAIAYAEDPVAIAKVLVEFAKRNEKLEILAAGLGETVVGAEGVQALTELPSLDELRAKIVGLLQAPAAKLVGVTQAPAQQMVGVLGAPAAKLAGVFRAYGMKDAA